QDEGGPVRQARAMLAEHGDGTRRHGLGGECHAVSLGAGDRDEEVAWRHVTRIRGDPCDRKLPGTAVDAGARRQERRERRRHGSAAAILGALSGGGLFGISWKRGSMPRSGATRSTTLPVVTPAFQAAVAKP